MSYYVCPKCKQATLHVECDCDDLDFTKTLKTNWEVAYNNLAKSYRKVCSELEGVRRELAAVNIFNDQKTIKIDELEQGEKISNQYKVKLEKEIIPLERLVKVYKNTQELSSTRINQLTNELESLRNRDKTQRQEIMSLECWKSKILNAIHPFIN